MSRRDAAKLIGAGGLGLALPSCAGARGERREFPRDFLWGCGTSAYQIEGAVTADGRGPSIWDSFTRRRGAIADHSNADVACDSYHRWAEDSALLKGLGVGAYRFSIAWPRIFPEGRGQPNVAGMDHYKRLIDGLLEAGITPYVTLFHWDLPSALPGGWQSRDTALAFGDYAGHVAREIGDRVRHFMTTNEVRSFIDLGYGTGLFAPGMTLGTGDLNQARHHALLAHGVGVQAIRAGAGGAKVGIAENPYIPVPVVETPEHIEAAHRAFRDLNAATMTTIMDGAYPEAWLKAQAGHAPRMGPEDMAVIGAPLDFIGLNVYNPVHIRADAALPGGYEEVPLPASYPRMMLPWLSLGPEASYWAIRHMAAHWRVKALYISENGCPSEDVVRPGGLVSDTDRILYLRAYMAQLHRAAEEDLPVKGYFLWSLLDNFEWAEGYSKRFGIHYVDFRTQQRIPKLSAEWYRALIAGNALV